MRPEVYTIPQMYIEPQMSVYGDQRYKSLVASATFVNLTSYTAKIKSLK